MWPWAKSVIGVGGPTQELKWGLEQANFNLRSHLQDHWLVLERTEEDVRYILELAKSPDLGEEECRELRDLITKDQFLDCTFDEARNRKLRSAYEELRTKASTLGTWTAREKFKVQAERAVIFAKIIGFLTAAGLVLGTSLLSGGTDGYTIAASVCVRSIPVIWKQTNLQMASLIEHKKALDETKRKCEVGQEIVRKNTATLIEVDCGMRGLRASAQMQAENIEKLMRQGGSETEKITGLCRMYRTTERLGILKRHKADLSRLIDAFAELIQDLERDIA